MEAAEAKMKELAFWIDMMLNRNCNYAVDQAAQGNRIQELEAKIKELTKEEVNN